MRTALYVLCAIAALAGFGMLLKSEYRTLRLLWLPLANVGGAIELLSFTIDPPLRYVLFYTGIAIIFVGIAANRIAKRRP